MSTADTIFALSSGQPPSAIGIIRISGPEASSALRLLSGAVPDERRASLAKLNDPDSGDLLDTALLLWFPGPNSASGEDLAEIHCHGGRAVIHILENALGNMDGLRRAEPGEFTRRAFTHGRMDMAEAEGLSDLLFAETELQRRSAIQAAGGALSRKVEDWQNGILRLSAMVEAELDFSDEDDVTPAQLDAVQLAARDLAAEMANMLARPRAEKLREGVRVVLGGPPNSGKSTLLNALVEREAAIVSPVAGTTRDVIEVPIAIHGIPFLFIDTAGVRDDGAEEIERIGIDRARQQFELADLILWLGPEGAGPEEPGGQGDNLVEIASRMDHPEYQPKSPGVLSVSPLAGIGMDALIALLVDRAKGVVPRGDEISVNQRQADNLAHAQRNLDEISGYEDYLIIAEKLRLARGGLDAITGRASTEDMLDSLFGKFCIGK